MSLKVRNVRRLITNIALILLLLIIGIAVARVLIFEHNYYSEQEGRIRERPTPVAGFEGMNEEIEIDDTEPTEQEIREYYVAADMPRYFTAPKANVEKSRIRSVGLTRDNKIDVPKNNYDVAWYNRSAKPGTGGTVFIDGHSGSNGIFRSLNKLKKGDALFIEMGNGTIYEYAVYETKDLPLTAANDYMATMMKTPVEGTESLSLITCSGFWSQNMQSYTKRFMVRATLVQKIEN